MGRKSGAYKFEKRRKEIEKKKKKEQKRLERLARKRGDQPIEGEDQPPEEGIDET